MVSTVGNLGTGWEPSPMESGMAILNQYQEGDQYTIYGTLDANGDIKIGFGARLDESTNNENQGIDNVRIYLTDLNYEDDQQYVLTVQASDGSLSATTTQTINVTNVNEAPWFEDGRAARSVAEDTSDNTDIAKVHAEDPEGDDNYVFNYCR